MFRYPYKNNLHVYYLVYKAFYETPFKLLNIISMII